MSVTRSRTHFTHFFRCTSSVAKPVLGFLLASFLDLLWSLDFMAFSSVFFSSVFFFCLLLLLFSPYEWLRVVKSGYEERGPIGSPQTKSGRDPFPHNFMSGYEWSDWKHLKTTFWGIPWEVVLDTRHQINPNHIQIWFLWCSFLLHISESSLKWAMPKDHMALGHTVIECPSKSSTTAGFQNDGSGFLSIWAILTCQI